MQKVESLDTSPETDLDFRYWIHGYFPGDLDWCLKCAEKKIAELKSDTPDGEYLLDGGWLTESDGVGQCNECHNMLASIVLPEGEVVDTEESLKTFYDKYPEA